VAARLGVGLAEAGEDAAGLDDHVELVAACRRCPPQRGDLDANVVVRRPRERVLDRLTRERVAQLRVPSVRPLATELRSTKRNLCYNGLTSCAAGW
jgi:hypothetical protein